MSTITDVLPGTGYPVPRYDRFLAAVLMIATFVAYHPALHGEQLLDDDVHITRPELRSPAGLARIWSDIGATQQY